MTPGELNALARAVATDPRYEFDVQNHIVRYTAASQAAFDATGDPNVLVEDAGWWLTDAERRAIEIAVFGEAD